MLGRGQDVIAIDADPAGNLGLAFGLTAALDAELKPIAEMESLIYERTGAQPGTIGGWFKLNPKVDDIPESFSITHRGVRLLRLGTVRGGGAGCLCPEERAAQGVGHPSAAAPEPIVDPGHGGRRRAPGPRHGRARWTRS